MSSSCGARNAHRCWKSGRHVQRHLQPHNVCDRAPRCTQCDRHLTQHEKMNRAPSPENRGGRRLSTAAALDSFAMSMGLAGGSTRKGSSPSLLLLSRSLARAADGDVRHSMLEACPATRYTCLRACAPHIHAYRYVSQALPYVRLYTAHVLHCVHASPQDPLKKALLGQARPRHRPPSLERSSSRPYSFRTPMPNATGSWAKTAKKTGRHADFADLDNYYIIY